MEWPWGILYGGVGTVLGDDAKSFRKPIRNGGSEPYGSPFGNPLPSALALEASAYGFRIFLCRLGKEFGGE